LHLLYSSYWNENVKSRRNESEERIKTPCLSPVLKYLTHITVVNPIRIQSIELEELKQTVEKAGIPFEIVDRYQFKNF